MFNHLLIPLDGSRLAEAALAAVLELASRFNSEITLLRVVTPSYTVINMGDGAYSVYAELLNTLRTQAFQEAEMYLKSHQAMLQQQGYKVQIHLAEGEPVAEHILDMAERLDVDTIIMSTHGRGGIGRWVYGSVADKVLRHANVPVLLIRVNPLVDSS